MRAVADSSRIHSGYGGECVLLILPVFACLLGKVFGSYIEVIIQSIKGIKNDYSEK